MMKLSVELEKWRIDRPDEWKMDEFVRNAQKLEAERNALAAKLKTAESMHLDNVRYIWESRNCGSCEELAEKHDALAATVEALREHAGDAAGALGFLSHHLRGRMGEVALMDMAEKADALNKALATTTQQHLRDVRAEVGRAGWVACVDWLVENSSADLFTDGEAEQAREIADQYAERVKEGKL